MATRDIIKCDRSSVYWSGEKRYIDVDKLTDNQIAARPLAEAKKCARLLSLKKALRLVEESKQAKLDRIKAYEACSDKTFDLSTEYGRNMQLAYDKAIRIPGIYTIAEYAILNKCSEAYIYNLCKSERIPSLELHHRCYIVFDEQLAEAKINKLKKQLSFYSLISTYAQERNISMNGLVTKKFVQANKFLLVGNKLLVKSR